MNLQIYQPNTDSTRYLFLPAKVESEKRRSLALRLCVWQKRENACC